MKNQLPFWIKTLILGCFSLFVLQGCSSEVEEMEQEEFDPVDRIEILEVSPKTGLVDGATETFNVTVKYNLASSETGTLMIGFNNTDSPNSFRMIGDEKKSVTQGRGEHTFEATIVVKDWGSESDFIVYVNISEDPLPPQWAPFDNDTFILIPKK